MHFYAGIKSFSVKQKSRWARIQSHFSIYFRHLLKLPSPKILTPETHGFALNRSLLGEKDIRAAWKNQATQRPTDVRLFLQSSLTQFEIEIIRFRFRLMHSGAFFSRFHIQILESRSATKFPMFVRTIN